MTTVAMATPYLTDTEINEICAPLKIGAAQRKHLERMGMLVKLKPNGRPLVARAEFERVMTGGQAAVALQENPISNTPNVQGLHDLFLKRRHGTRT